MKYLYYDKLDNKIGIVIFVSDEIKEYMGNDYILTDEEIDFESNTVKINLETKDLIIEETKASLSETEQLEQRISDLEVAYAESL